MPEEFHELRFYMKPVLNCQYCHKDTYPKESILVILPGKNEGCEFCSITCLVRFFLRMVKRRIVNKKTNTNLLKILGFNKNWGVDVSKDIKIQIPKNER